MRSRETIEKEIYRAREDLEARLAELRHYVREKVDVRARAQAMVAERRQQAVELARRGADTVKVGAIRTKDGFVFVYRRAAKLSREQPVLVSTIAAGLLAVTVAAILLVRHYRKPWYRQ
jgi:hypothetical protein